MSVMSARLSNCCPKKIRHSFAADIIYIVLQKRFFVNCFVQYNQKACENIYNSIKFLSYALKKTMRFGIIEIVKLCSEIRPYGQTESDKSGREAVLLTKAVRNIYIRITAVLAAAVMLLAALPVSAFAEGAAVLKQY